MNNFTPKAQNVLAEARKLAIQRKNTYVGAEHLLWAIASLSTRLFDDADIVKKDVDCLIQQNDVDFPGNLPYTPRVKHIFARAGVEAKRLGSSYVGSEHLLLGLIIEINKDGNLPLKEILIKNRVTEGTVKQNAGMVEKPSQKKTQLLSLIEKIDSSANNEERIKLVNEADDLLNDWLIEKKISESNLENTITKIEMIIKRVIPTNETVTDRIIAISQGPEYYQSLHAISDALGEYHQWLSKLDKSK